MFESVKYRAEPWEFWDYVDIIKFEFVSQDLGKNKSMKSPHSV